MYADKEMLQNYLGPAIDDSLNDYVKLVIAAAQDYIERYCGNGVIERRVFEATETETRYYNGHGKTKLQVDDILEIESLAIDNVELEENKDYYLDPLNKAPKTQIDLDQSLPGRRNSRSPATYEFERGQRNVAITGKFGYSKEVPAAIKIATARIAGAIIQENISDNDLRRLSSEQIGDYRVSFEDAESAANNIGVHKMLEQYKRKDRRGRTNMRKI